MPPKLSSSSFDPSAAGPTTAGPTAKEPTTEPHWSYRYPSDYESISSFEEVPPWKQKPSKWAEVNKVDAIFEKLIRETTKREEEKEEKKEENGKEEKGSEGNLRFQGMTTEEIIDNLMNSRESHPRSFGDPHEDFPELREDDCSDSEGEERARDEALAEGDDGSEQEGPRLVEQIDSLGESFVCPEV